MEETRMTPDQEQARVRAGALIVHGVALVVAVVLVALGLWTTAAAVTVVAGVAGWWARSMYAALQAQALQERALTTAARRFTPPPNDFDG
jgi:hypothetical protein